jgi:hypothetical protein
VGSTATTPPTSLRSTAVVRSERRKKGISVRGTTLRSDCGLESGRADRGSGGVILVAAYFSHSFTGRGRVNHLNGSGRAKHGVPRGGPYTARPSGRPSPGTVESRSGRVGTGSKSCWVSGQAGGPYRLDIYTYRLRFQESFHRTASNLALGSHRSFLSEFFFFNDTGIGGQ